MDWQRLLRLAVEARIEAWDQPSIDDRDEAAGDVGLMLQEVVRRLLPHAVTGIPSLDGVRELSARIDGDKRLHLVGAFRLLDGNDDSMLPVEADLDVSPGAASTLKLGGEPSVFAMPTGERQFARQMEHVVWEHQVTFSMT